MTTPNSDVPDSKVFTGEKNALNLEIPKNEGSGDQIDAKGLGIWPLNKSTKAVSIDTPICSLDYKMNHPNRGVALIFNHKTFKSRLNLNERRGTDVDRDKLRELAIHLGFSEEDVHVFNDLSKMELMKQLEFYADRDYTNDDCLFVAVCTHGDKGVLYAQDTKYPSEHLWEPFTGDKCPTLAGKPKLFFLQACQGDRIDSGVPVDEADGRERYYKIPAFADFLITYSTCPGFYSWRNVQAGSWFMQAFYEILKEHSRNFDLLSMLTLVNHKVAYDFISCVPHDSRMDQKKQIPCVTSMLTRRVTFTPKKTPEISN